MNEICILMLIDWKPSILLSPCQIRVSKSVLLTSLRIVFL